MTKDEKFMLLAIKEATKAKDIDEVPIGAVIVVNDKVISRGYNTREKSNDSTNHAEIIAIKKACKKLNNWRLIDAILYVTIEPCPMCAGAILQSRIKKVVYGAKDIKGGALGSTFNLFEQKNLNHHPTIIGGVLEEECSKIIKDYFKNKR